MNHGLTASYLFTPPPGRDASRYDCVYAPGDACTFRGVRRTVGDVVRTLADEGFDVGLHGSYHAGLRPGALAAERETIERATGLRLKSTRQHLLHWDVRSTPHFQAQAGFSVDSSLGFNSNVGFRAGNVTAVPLLPDVPGASRGPACAAGRSHCSDSGPRSVSNEPAKSSASSSPLPSRAGLR